MSTLTVLVFYTLHLTPYTLHPTPYTLRPTPYILLSTPFCLLPTPRTYRANARDINADGARPAHAERPHMCTSRVRLDGSLGEFVH